MRISVQLFDCVHGAPAAGVAVRWERDAGEGWRTVHSGGTDTSGRYLVADDGAEGAAGGPHRIAVATDEYFVGLGLRPYYRGIVVALPRAEAAGLELRLALSPFAYTLTVSRVPTWSAAAPTGPAARR